MGCPRDQNLSHRNGYFETPLGFLTRIDLKKEYVYHRFMVDYVLTSQWFELIVNIWVILFLKVAYDRKRE